MAEDDPAEPVYTFFAAWFALTLAVFPLLATVNSALLGGSFGSGPVLLASVVVTLPGALEFLFSDRDTRLAGRFVAVFVGLFFLALVAQAGVYVSLGRTDTIPAVEFALLFVAYALAYALVYKGGLARLKAAVTR